MVVISIIGILLGLLVPAIQRTKDAVRSAACKNNLRQIGVAVLSYVEDNDGRYPYYPAEVSNSLGLIYPQYMQGDPRLFRCPGGNARVPNTIDMTLTGNDVRGTNGVQMSYDSSRLAENLVLEPAPGQTIKSTLPLVWDWYGGLEPGEGTPAMQALNNHKFRGGNVLYVGGHVKWVSAKNWSTLGLDDIPDEE